MSNIIDKIQLSGVTYDIGGQGGSGVSVVEVTQAGYDALPTSAKTDTSKMYVITDAEAGDLSQYWTSAQTNSAINQAVSGKADTSAVTEAIDESISGKANSSDVYLKSETSGATQLATAFENKQDTLASGFNIKTINNESILGGGNIDIQGGGGGGKAVAAGTNISVTTGETADTINCTLPIYSGTNLDGSAAGAESIRFTTQTSFGSSKGLRSIRGRYNSNALGEDSICFGINSFVRGAVSFGVGRDLDSYGNYATIFGYGTNTKNIFETAIGKYNTSNSGSTEADNTLFSVGNGASNSARHNAFEIRQNGDIYLSSGGTDIKLQDHLGGGGGGKAIEAGRGISVTTGETADTVSFNLPISAGTGVDSITEGDRTTASGDYSHTEGGYSTANGNYSHAEGMATITYGMSSHAEGYVTEARNKYEHASGAYNVSSSATTEFGHSGNTLFSVGNGTSSSAKHNAFEIRQNGDIYITKDGQDVKLQDQLGGGGGSITIDPTLDSGSTNAVANSAITNAFKNTDYVTASYSGGLVNLMHKDPFNTNYRDIVFFGNINGSSIASIHSSTRPSFSLVETSAITTSITSSSTDAQVPSAKAVYDALGGGGSSYTAGDGIDITNDVISVTGKVDTSAITTSITSSSTDAQVPSAKAVNDKLGGLSIVKLTQAQYDALATKDNSTLYVING